jgi:tellurite methyltransferase
MSQRPSAELRAQFGEIDIYLFDQIARGRFDRRPRILDAGCGGGRNLPFFFAHGFEVHVSDIEPGAIDVVRALAREHGASLPDERLHCGSLESLPWQGGVVDAVICSAVLHFARDEAQFAAMLREMWRVLAPGGLFFARLATSIGIERFLPALVGRLRLPDGSERFVMDERGLREWTQRLGGSLADPIKTTNVQNQRAMTTWVVEKSLTPNSESR